MRAIGGPFDGREVDWPGIRGIGPVASYIGLDDERPIWFSDPIWTYEPAVLDGEVVTVFHETPMSLDELAHIEPSWRPHLTVSGLRRERIREAAATMRPIIRPYEFTEPIHDLCSWIDES